MSAELAGRLIITWPKSDGIMLSHRILLTDADTGEQIVSALNGELTVQMDAGSVVTVELTMLAGADGKPLRRGEREVLAADGERLHVDRFRWAVAEMRIANE